MAKSTVSKPRAPRTPPSNPYWRLKRIPTQEEAAREVEFHRKGLAFWTHIAASVDLFAGVEPGGNGTPDDAVDANEGADNGN